MRHALSSWLALAAAALLWGGAAGCATSRDQRDATEVPAGEREVELVFRGARDLGDRRLSQAIGGELADFARNGYPKWPMDDAAFSIEELQRSAGYPFAEVDYEIDMPEAGPITVTFDVRPGPFTQLVEVRTPGLSAFDPETVRAFFGLADEGAVPYVEAEVSRGIGDLTSRYLNEGYVDATVGRPLTDFSEDRSRVALTIPVREGARFVLRSVDVEVDAPDVEAPLSTRAAAEVGQPFRLRLPLEIRERLRAVLADSGYLFPDVAIERSRDEVAGTVELLYRIDAGERVVIDAVEVRGLESTRRQVVMERLTLGPGDVYTTGAERESFERLYRTGVFRGVRIFPERDPEGRWLAVVEVDEAETTTFFVEPGYGSYERLRLKLGFREANLFGRANRLRLEATVGELAQRGEIGIAQPNFLDIGADTTGELTFFADNREEPSFTERNVGVSTTLSQRWSRALQGSVGYQFRRSDVVEVLSQDAEAEAAIGEFDISSVSASLSWNTRNNVFLPTEGGSTRVSADYADGSLGSELDFTRLRLTQSLFHSLGEGTVLALSLKLGAIAPHGSTDEVPIQERFFNGGENTVRSFTEDELGPKDDEGNPIGGEAYTALSVELRQDLPIVNDNLGMAAFVDFGGLALRWEDIFDYGAIDTGLGIGMGLRYLLPIGPVRLDAGWNPDPEPFESDVVLHLSVGLAF